MNIYDIAKEANVSIATVSRVLNNKPNVRPETRDKVEQVLKRHNYAAEAGAPELPDRAMKTVGILMIDIRIPHYAASAYALEQELYRMGYNVIICNTGGQTGKNLYYLKMLAEKGVCGIIVLGSVFINKYSEAALVNDLATVPVILINTTLDIHNVYAVMLNNKRGMQLCLEHLLARGRQDILYIQDAYSYAAKDKAAQFIKQAHKLGLERTQSHIFQTERGVRGGKEVLGRLLASGEKFTALIFGDDTTALGALLDLEKKGYRVPEDVAVIGWNNSITALSGPYYNITTVENKTELMCSLTTRLLENLVEGREVSRCIYIDPDLVVRETT